MGNTHRGRYRTDTWRRKVIKKYKRRAIKFHDESDTNEEKQAWKKVIRWFETILEKSRLNKNEAISLPFFDIEELDQDSLLNRQETEK